MKGPVKFTGTPAPAPTPAPTFGQHSDEILTSCGYSAEEIAALRQRAVVL
jgi:crotonobetainyl-CoA:carnitine CoA-transferase CaiB-like acyl-CoA transferase